MIDFRDEVVYLLKDQIEFLSEDEIKLLVEVPPSYDMGDYAFPTFRLAKEQKSLIL